MGGTCSTRGRVTNTEFWSEKLKGRDHSEEPGIDGNIILEWVIGI
jgi:hypothetical protein